MINCTINGKSATLNLSNKQLQVLLTGKFGDGCLSTPKTCKDNSKFVCIQMCSNSRCLQVASDANDMYYYE